MRILFFSSIFPRPDYPTRGIYCLHWCRAWSSADHAVRVVSPRSCWEKRRPRSAEKQLDGVDVIYPGYFYPIGFMRASQDWFMWRWTARQLRNAIAEFNPDCIVCYWTHPDGAVAVRAAKEFDVPLAIIVGGSDVLLLPDRNQACRAAVIATLKQANAVITVGQYLRHRVIQLGISPENVHVAYQGVASDFAIGNRADARARLNLPASDPTLLWVGRMDPVKGLDVLLDACTILRSRKVAFRLHLVGDGPERSHIESGISSRGLSELVHVAGHVPHDALPDWYRAADLTILPSHSEGVPNVLRESLACGTPFVASRVGGISELINGDRSLLVPPGNAEALAMAISHMFVNPPPPFRSKLSTWDESAAQIIEILQPTLHRA